MKIFGLTRQLATCWWWFTRPGLQTPNLRDQALRAAKSVCLNIAEAVGRYSAADQKRVFAIARGEVCEVNSALDIAALIGECPPEKAQAGAALARGVYALLSGLIRK